MTSAANHLQQLNGSKMNLKLIVLSLLCIIFASCGSQQKGVKKVEEKPETDEVVVEEVTIDTIHWTVLDPEKHPPVNFPDASPFRDRIPDKLPAPTLKEVYYIALVLPIDDWPLIPFWEEFLIDSINAPQETRGDEMNAPPPEPMISFLNGFEEAFRLQDQEGTRFVVEVIAGGEDGTNEELLEKLNQLQNEPDLVVGGNSRLQLQMLSEFVADRGGLLLNPWVPTSFNPMNGQMVSILPSLSDHLKAVIDRLKLMEEGDKFFAVFTQREVSRVEEFQKLFHREFPDRKFGEIILLDDKEILEFEFEEFFSEEGKTFFFLPMTRNHPFIYPILRTLDLQKRDHEIEILGITLWDRNIQTELHQKLDIVNTSSISPLYADSSLYLFNEMFYNHFDYIGGVEEYEGFVVGEFVRRNLIAYGPDFHLYLPFTSENSGYYKYLFSEEEGLDTPVEEFGNIPSNLKNKGIFLIKFNEGRFHVLTELK